MNAFPGAGPVSKRPRIDAANDDWIWGQDDEFTADDLAQVDLISSQALSQCPKASINPLAIGGTTLQRHHSWTGSPNENVLPKNVHHISKSRSSFMQLNPTGNGCKGNQLPATFKNRSLANGSPYKPEVKSWNDSAFGGQKLPGMSLQEIERQKQELKRLQEDKIKYESQIKQLNDALSRKDFEIQSAHSEVDSLKQQSVIKERRQQDYLQEIGKLKTELEFKRQEHASEQWKACHQQHIRQNNDSHSNKKIHVSPTDGSQPRQKIFKSPLNVTEDNNCFPSQITFLRRISLKTSEGASEIAGISSVTPCATEICQKQNDSVLQLKRPLGIETGPGLVDIILQQAGSVQLSTGSLVSKIIGKNDTNGGCDWIATPIQAPKNKLSVTTCLSPPNSPQQLQNEQWSLDLMTGFSRLLEDDGVNEVKEDTRVPLVPPELNIFNICLGLRLDYAKSMLSSIDKALFRSFGVNSMTSVIPELEIPSSSSSHVSNLPLTKPCNPADETLKLSVQNAISALKQLKQLVYYSPGVCQCLIHEKAENVQTRSKNVLLNSDPQPGTSFASSIQDLGYNAKHSTHPIIQKLFEICSQPIQFQSIDASLLQLALEILGTVAIYCPFDELPRFLPLITPQVLHNCSSLALGGSIFLELVSLLGTLCLNPNVVEASCNQDDSCFWIPLSIAWQAARKELSPRVMSKLDNLMIQLLSLCLTHEGVKTPFLSTDEIHCQFEIISGLILYLHNQSVLYEESPNLLSIPTLRNGISLLHQVATRDANFRHHRAQVNFEMFTFLHWLARTKTGLKIGPAAEMLLEMWNIKEYGPCENKEDFPWIMKSFA